jgi:hypothetical protein
LQASLECGGFDAALLLTNVEGRERQMKTKMKMLEGKGLVAQSENGRQSRPHMRAVSKPPHSRAAPPQVVCQSLTGQQPKNTNFSVTHCGTGILACDWDRLKRFRLK